VYHHGDSCQEGRDDVARPGQGSTRFESSQEVVVRGYVEVDAGDLGVLAELVYLSTILVFDDDDDDYL
jgi:hypothetical protein